jgi:hypothetical protein
MMLGFRKRFLMLTAACALVALCARGAAVAAAEERGYWAFQPVERPVVPTVAHADRVRTPVDAFVLDRLEQRRLTLSPPAGKRELLRRAKFDLVGLPPTPEEIDLFLADNSPDAYERMVDRLLDSPQYGETWGRHWLDLVRFADTAGYKEDSLRPLAYKYRDYVIRALNRDTPYDRFVQEQLAGDELFPNSLEAIVGSGYNRLWPDESNASNILLARQDAFNDLTANVGSVFLGLSLGCAQCHDHKFDPILQTDFYRLQAFFVGIFPRDRLAVGSVDQLAAYGQQYDQWLTETETARVELHAIEQSARVKAGHEKRLKFPAIVLDAIDTAPEKRTALQHQLAFWSERQIKVEEKEMLAKMNDEQKRQRTELREQVDSMVKARPEPPRPLETMSVGEQPEHMPKTHLLAGGSYNKPLRELQPGFLSALDGATERPVDVVPPRPGTSGRRTTLARWLTDPSHPLTARVMVNRIWQGHFGCGLVENANDFGTQTAPPTHPELLDWLAAEFVSSGWSTKAMHRLIMTSEVYRQASYGRAAGTTPDDAETADADNTLYWRHPRRRATAEATRDAMLAVAGKLNAAMYGPGVRPDLPRGFSSEYKWEASKDASDHNRRSIYILAKRNLPFPMLDVFDLPDMHESCARRAVTTTAPQALMLLNGDQIIAMARGFADRLRAEDPQGQLPALIRRAYVLAFGREPTDREAVEAAKFIDQQEKLVAASQATSPDAPSTADPARDAALIDLCHALLNANEFVYID